MLTALVSLSFCSALQHRRIQVCRRYSTKRRTDLFSASSANPPVASNIAIAPTTTPHQRGQIYFLASSGLICCYRLRARNNTLSRWYSRYTLCPSVNAPTFTTSLVATPMRSSDGLCATGENNQLTLGFEGDEAT